jgi:hypothetical protein
MWNAGIAPGTGKPSVTCGHYNYSWCFQSSVSLRKSKSLDTLLGLWKKQHSLPS